MGLGFLFGVGTGKSTLWNTERSNNKFDDDMSRITFGFLLDTRVAKQGLINYRLNAALQILTYKDLEKDFTKMVGLVFDNTLGFGVVQTDLIRLYVGPQLRLSYHLGRVEYTVNYNYTYVQQMIGAGIGIGPNVGINFNIGKLITITAETGYRFNYTYNEWKDDFYTNKENIEITDSEYFFNLGLLFRINDVFSTKLSKQ